MPHSDAWICLMYHDVVPATEATGGGPERFAVPRASFERMLDTITALGLVGCSVDRAISVGGERRVAISFDDGTVSQFEYAFPALRERDMTATFFVTTNWIGQPGFMTWDHLQQLVSCGMSVQSHTKSHPFLAELGEEELVAELAGSKAALDKHLAQETTQLSLPGGSAPRRAHRHLLQDVGYQLVASSRWGTNAYSASNGVEGRWIRRCTVRGSHSTAQMRRILAGDIRIALARYPREAFLHRVRAVLGASRYARFRRRFLNMFVR